MKCQRTEWSPATPRKIAPTSVTNKTQWLFRRPARAHRHFRESSTHTDLNTGNALRNAPSFSTSTRISSHLLIRACNVGNSCLHKMCASRAIFISALLVGWAAKKSSTLKIADSENDSFAWSNRRSDFICHYQHEMATLQIKPLISFSLLRTRRKIQNISMIESRELFAVIKLINFTTVEKLLFLQIWLFEWIC